MKVHAGILLAGAVQSLVAAAPAPGSTRDSYKPLVRSQPFQNAIKTEKLMGNLEKLQEIATANGGNRAFGLPGFAASRDFILSRQRKAKGFRTWVQDFPALFNSVTSISFREAAANSSYHVVGLSYSPSTSAEGLTAPLALGVFGAEGCNAASYQGRDVAGKIVLVQRGTCPDGSTLAGRVRPAAAAGAAAVIVYTDLTTPVTGGSLSAPDPNAFVPAGFINKVDGEALRARLEAGEAISAYFQQTQVVETKITQNVFSETVDGDETNTIMLGAHLDGVQAGPGINDDGSGSSLILELATALTRFRTRNKVRFAWWGAEENGLLGSRYYVRNLNATAADNILTYLNFDMVSRGYFGVFDGDGNVHGLAGAPGSDAIERIFVDDLTAKGINVTAARFTGGSDYKPFMDVGKPVGGLHTGTGVAQDPCYHQKCDTIDNPNPHTLTVNAKTAAHVLSILAVRGQDIIPKRPVNATVTARGLEGRAAIQWTTDEEDRHLEGCGHNI